MPLSPPTIGQRRLRAVLEEPVEAGDGLGGVLRSYQPRVTLWVRIEPLKGLERAEAERAEAAVSHRISLRWRGDVTGAMRFAIGAHRYNVRALFDPDGRRRTLHCLVEEVRP
jgi:SPP1 family predicted phage head-tail adaptor